MSRTTRIELVDSGVNFNPYDHTYELNGNYLSGITDLLQRQLFPDEYANIPKAILEQAAAYGTAVHQSCEDFDANWYNDGSQEVQDYLQLCQEHSLTHEASEYTVTDYSNYASNIDKVFRISDNTFDLADLKTYGKMTPEKLEKARWQLSIYAYLFELQNKKAKARELYILHIRNKQKKDGSFDHISALIPVKRIPSEICKELLDADLRGEQFQSPYSMPKEISSQEQRIRELILTKEAVEEELNGIKSQILTEMETRNVKTWITDGGIRLTRKLPTTRTSLNLSMLKEEHPEIDYEHYMKASLVSSSLTITV
jgi:hypothetical protein